jgi:hypothetical protein
MAFRINTGLSQAGLSAGQMIGSALGQLGGSIGGMLTRGGEAISEGREAEKMAGIYAPTTQEGATSTELFQAAQQLMSMGKTSEGMAMVEQARAMQQTEAEALAKQQEQAGLQALQESIADSATRLGLPDIAERASNTTDPESLRAIQKDLREQEVKNLIRERGEPGRKALAKRYGITYESYMGDLDDDNFFKLLEGQEAELKSFLLPDGAETLLEVNKKDGKVRDPSDGVFKRASELGLRKAPNRQQVENIANYTSELLAEAGVKHFQELHTSTSQTIETLNNIEEVLPLTDEMITGATAQPELFVRRIKSEMSEFLGIDATDPALQNTEAYIALAAPRVAEIIKNFGAGTGLSDADREFANKAAAGDIAMTAASLQRILKILKKAGENKISLYNKTVKEMKIKPGSYGFVLPSRTKATPPTTQATETVSDLPAGFVKDQ